MADAKISALGAITTPLGTEMLAGATAAGADCFLTSTQVADLARLVPAYTAGRYYPMHPVFKATNGPVLIGNARMYLVPFIPPRNMNIDRLFAKTWGGGDGSSLAAIAVYDSQALSSGQWPTGNPIATGSSTFVPSAGFQSYEKTISQGTVSLKQGHLYFAALQCNQAINFYANDLQFSIALMGNSSTEFDNSNAGLVSANGIITVGTWPDLTTSQSSGNYGPAAPSFELGFRAA